ncbi:MAG: 7TM diverse intracellular signaling domain-containing protein [Flammeovirgaceae bacterium]
MLRPFIILFLALMAFVDLRAQDMLELSEESDTYPMGRFVSVYVDTAGLPFETVSSNTFASNFIPSSKEVLHFGINRNVYWIRFTARELTSPAKEWLLWIDFPILDHIELYEQNGDGELINKRTMGFCEPFDNRPIRHANFAIPLEFNYSQPTTFYIKVYSKKAKILPLSIVSKDAFYQGKSAEDILYGLLFGILFVMLLYNGFVYYALKDRSYLYYVLTILSTALFFGGSSGYAFQYIWSDYPEFNTISLILFTCLLIITTNSFSQSFLKIKQHSKFLDWSLTAGKIISGLAAISLFILDDVMPVGVGMYLVISITILQLLASGIVSWRKGYRPAIYFTIAWLGYLLGGLSLTFVNWNIFSFNFFTYHASELGATLMVILLGLALSESYRLLKKEKEEASKKVIKMQEEANQVLEKRVHERTAELMETNEELNQIVEELNMTNDQLNGLNTELSKRNKKITDSLNYAKRIQTAILPFPERINRVVEEHFVFFKPRDIVSGDFYWFEEHDDKIFLAAVDCTGHGVPGAFMSLLAHDALTHTVISQGITEPDKILTYLDLDIRTILQQERTANKDGMDMTICVIDPNAQTIEFAGAKNPMIYFQDDNMYLIKGDKFSVGGQHLKHMKRFTKRVIDISKPTTFYLFSDGYQDQFGGQEGRKFLSKRFRELLNDIHSKPMPLQKTILDETFHGWMRGVHKQIDDVLVMGFRIGNNGIGHF